VPARVPLYHEVLAQITARLDPRRVPAASAVRLALLVTGILAAKSCVLAQVAAELDALALTLARRTESVGRRLRRTLNDGHLTQATCYAPLLPAVLDWPALLAGERRVVLILDESSQADRIHLFRLSLAYRGGSLPLAWAVWEQNVPLPAGGYWAHVDAVLAAAAALLPAGVEVTVVGDRAFAVPALVDRLAARGWHWVLRLTTTGSHRFRDHLGAEHELRTVVARRLPRPGRRFKARGELFKDAGWRAASLVGLWAAGAEEPLVVSTDLPPTWAVLRRYDRRFWIEAGFRTDKTKGWQWEASQVRGVAHHQVLLLGMAWASLVTLCLGAAEAEARLARLAARPDPARPARRPAKPQPPRESLFTLGLRCLRRHLYGTAVRPLTWHLPDLAAPSWLAHWRHRQSLRFIFFSPVRP
jgi:Transposase DDE domain